MKLLFLILDPKTRSGFGVARTEDADANANAKMRVDTARGGGCKRRGAVAASDEFLYSGTMWGNSLLSKVRQMVMTTTTTMGMDAPFLLFLWLGEEVIRDVGL